MKWYDYVVAVVAADFILANIILLLTGPTFFVQFLAALAITFLYDLWINVYCKFRLKMEMKDME
jgi:hypothetical protein